MDECIEVMREIMGMETERAENDLVVLARLRIDAEADPSVLARLIGRLQNLNILPRRVIAEFGSCNSLHIEVDISGVADGRMSLIAAKAREDVCVLNAYWHRI
jgi:hypothetical protein